MMILVFTASAWSSPQDFPSLWLFSNSQYSHVNIFCLETRLKRALFAYEALRVNALERVPSETNEGFRRDYYRNVSECALGLTCVQTRPQ